MKLGSDTKEFQFFRDYWNLLQKYYDKNINKTDEFWQDLIKESRQLADKYDNNSYAIDLIVSFVTMIENDGYID